MSDRLLTPAQVLELIPQRPPFRFVDQILEVDGEVVRGSYTFHRDEPFYAGHFPGEALTPGVIVAEAMAQQALLPLSLYLITAELPDHDPRKWIPLLTEVTVEFLDVVKPGERVTTRGETVFWRKRKLRCHAEMTREDGVRVARGTLAAILRESA